jgi:hypothetical protein
MPLRLIAIEEALGVATLPNRRHMSIEGRSSNTQLVA